MSDTQPDNTPSKGWFAMHVKDSNWVQSSRFGSVCNFEGKNRFPDLGFNIRLLNPGQPASLYHQENGQENFLVLSGKCRLIIAGEEQQLETGHFVHCPSQIPHVFVGAGDGPCVILMVGHRPKNAGISFPVSELAAKDGASVEKVTDRPRKAYGQWPIFDKEAEAVWPLW